MIPDFALVNHVMFPQNQLVTREAVAAPVAVPSYRALLLRLWLVRARLGARAAVDRYRPNATNDDRRLAATLVAGGVAFLTLLACLVVGFSATTYLALIAIGFFATLGIGMVLLFGPDDYDCDTEFTEVTGQLPEAKRVWQEQRAAAQAARKQARAERKQARAARKLAKAAAANTPEVHTGMGSASVVDLVESIPDDGASAAPEELEGDGSFAVPVLGEVHIGRILEEVCRNELPLAWQDKVVGAVLRFENTNRNAKAVSVEIEGRKVGHLSPADAQALWHWAGGDSREFQCRAVIHAGSKAGRIHYDLRLDINLGVESAVVAVSQ